MYTLHASDLAGRRILVVEDDAELARDLARTITQAGAEVLGPVADLAGALRIVEAELDVHAVLLDMRFGERSTLATARLLRERGVPIMFVAGDDGWFVPNDFEDVPVYRATEDPGNVVRILFPPAVDRR